MSAGGGRREHTRDDCTIHDTENRDWKLLESSFCCSCSFIASSSRSREESARKSNWIVSWTVLAKANVASVHQAWLSKHKRVGDTKIVTSYGSTAKHKTPPIPGAETGCSKWLGTSRLSFTITKRGIRDIKRNIQNENVRNHTFSIISIRTTTFPN